MPKTSYSNIGGKIQKIAIIGGGTAGWMAAAGLARFLSSKGVEIELVESEAIGTIGVGEATLPHIRYFNKRLGIDEKDFMAKTNATIKLGIEFVDWGRIGDRYIHPFGEYGDKLGGIEFHHYWLRNQMNGDTTPIDAYSLPIVASYMNRCDYPDEDMHSLKSTYSYAFQFDAGLYAQYLRKIAEKNGVIRTEGRITSVQQHSENGHIRSVTLENGDIIEADFFIDCSGFRGLLIKQALGVELEDWSKWLPCDRAVAIPCESSEPFTPYTRATALEAGWQWRIPLQHRIGNGYVYCSKFISDDEATEKILGALDGKPTADPKVLRFQAGMRRQSWEKNCIAIGLSSGFLEPLESTSIYLIQVAITNLIELFPDFDHLEKDRSEYNHQMQMEYDRIRDFLILHYHATERDDTPFWNYVRTMDIPDSLQYKINLFREHGSVVRYKDGLFLHPSWIAVYMGQRIIPNQPHPLAMSVSDEQLAKDLTNMRQVIHNTAEAMPLHRQFIMDNCPIKDFDSAKGAVL